MRTIILISMLMVGCASPQPQSCQEADWYEIGRRHGALGKVIPEEIKEGLKVCEESNREMNRNLYLNGRNAGLVEYCKPGNAFELGKENQSYENVCPTDLSEVFIESYNKGQNLRRLEEAVEDIDRKISSIFEKTQSQANEKDRLNELQRLKAENLSKIYDLERSQN